MAGVVEQVFSMIPFVKILTIFFVFQHCMELTGVNCAPLNCGREKFWDKDAKRCEFCSYVCESAKIQGTLVKCLKNCPDYPETTTVPLFDNHTTPASTAPDYTAFWTVDVVAIVTTTAVTLAAAVAALIYRQKLYSWIRGILYKLKLIGEDLRFPVQEEGGNRTVTEDEPQPGDNLIGNPNPDDAPA